MVIGVIRVIMVIIVIKVIRAIRVIMVILVIRVLKINYYQSTFNSQKEKLYILSEMIKISKSGCGSLANHYHYRSSCQS